METKNVTIPGRSPSAVTDPETLALYDALDGVPVIPASHAPAPIVPESTPEAAEQPSKSYRGVPFKGRLRKRSGATTVAAWSASALFHLVPFLAVLLIGSTSFLLAKKKPLSSPIVPEPLREVRLGVSDVVESDEDLVIPIARPRADDPTSVSATTKLLLEIAIDGQGNARLVRARTESVPDDVPLSLSCARVSVVASPAR